MKLPNLTPGDWMLTPNHPSRIISETLEFVASVYNPGDDGMEREEEAADARAIAAVPQLLAALSLALPILWDEYDNRLSSGEGAEYAEPARLAFESARAALIAAGATE